MALKRSEETDTNQPNRKSQIVFRVVGLTILALISIAYFTGVGAEEVTRIAQPLFTVMGQPVIMVGVTWYVWRKSKESPSIQDWMVSIFYVWFVTSIAFSTIYYTWLVWILLDR